MAGATESETYNRAPDDSLAHGTRDRVGQKCMARVIDRENRANTAPPRAGVPGVDLATDEQHCKIYPPTQLRLVPE